MSARFAAMFCVAAGIAGCASVRIADTASDVSLKQFSTRPDVAGVSYGESDQSGAKAAGTAATIGLAFLGILLQIFAAPALLLP